MRDHTQHHDPHAHFEREETREYAKKVWTCLVIIVVVAYILGRGVWHLAFSSPPAANPATSTSSAN